MNDKTKKLVYWTATGLLSVMTVMSASMYVFNHEVILELFEGLGYPGYLVYPLALAKLLGIMAIITKYSKTLKDFAYAGFLFDFILATTAHLSVGDGEHYGAILALILWAVSFTMDRIMFSDK